MTQTQIHQTDIEPVRGYVDEIVHKLSNLLTSIGGRSELLLLRLGPDDPMRGHLEQIRNTVAQAGLLTRRLLAVGREEVPPQRREQST